MKYKSKRCPSYYWKFGKNKKEIVIISDKENFPIITTIEVKNEDASKEIEKANKIIIGLMEGRLNEKSLTRK